MRGNELLDKMELIAPVYVEAAERRPKRKRGRWGALAACFCLLAAAAVVIPRLLLPGQESLYVSENPAGTVQTPPAEEQTAPVEEKIVPAPAEEQAASAPAEEKAEISPTPTADRALNPEAFNRTLTLAEARADADFGAYLPQELPAGFREESVRRYRDEYNDDLSGIWTKGYDELSWRVSFYTEKDAERLTGVAETENYDLALYPIPRANSVPDELREIVNDPIFTAEELTEEAVRARAYKTGESGDSDGWRMAFSVKYGGVLVRVNAKGVEPEWLYHALAALAENG